MPIALFLWSVGISQELPPIQNFSPADYSSESQNWAVSQSSQKLIYIANNKGLLEFDGARWTLYPSPNASILRSVKVVGSRIYTGCYMEFGFWEKDNVGILQYTSLSAKIKDQLSRDEEFWGILEFGDWIVFQSHNKIYSYNLSDDRVNTIDSETFVPKIFKVDRTIHFQKMGKGVFRIENGRDILVYDQEPLKTNEIINIFTSGRELLFLTRDDGFFRTNNGKLEKWNVPVDKLLSGISLYSGLQLNNGNFALGTISHGLIITDEYGNIIQQINQLNGLQNNTVLSLYEDLDRNIWLGLDVGISYINIGSPFRVYPDGKGLVGGVYASIIKDGRLYLGTNQGLFYKVLDTKEDFRFIEGTEGQVWSLSNIDDTLFVGHHTGTYQVIGNSARQISNVQGTWKVGSLENKQNLLLQGNYDGLYILEKVADTWRLRNKIDGFEHSARYFEVFDNQIFVNHEYKGVFKLEVKEDFSNVTSLNVDTDILGSNSGIIKYKGDLLYAYQKGVFKYDWNSNSFVRDSILSGLYKAKDYTSGKMLVDRKNGYLWTFSNTNIGYVTEGRLASTPTINQIPLTENIRNGIIGYESATALPENDHYLFGARSGYFTIDVQDFRENEIEVSIGSVQKAGKNRIETEKSLIDPTGEGKFNSEENSLEITYYVPDYSKYLKPQYQYRLEGIYPNWSDWSETASVSFENLPSGSYTFQVRAKMGERISDKMDSYSFKIARPWYLSNLFLALYIIGGILGSILIHSSYRRYYHSRQRKLIAENQREMELTKAQNEKEIIKLKNKQLQEEFKSKSNELAASTMSIIKKNELLTKVKEQLASSIEDKESVKPIIHVIDKNLNQNDDWELFKEAFNNADRKFLKKLKKAHPNLSPNDIRLCAYLRLNLSSKEIAPMFNISPRSVEIKRYRLRKKMNLEHDDNLVDYILKL
ncbi:helix-turn-helix and ligand-binding sensor domain-containing protein [Flagellimonas flava]|uniref:helix-turn-helix and ligand-binding sensor domain-containing protein n=1 Tax=Flagellimonas flava TaxID=570519 RepID=UPI0009FD5D9A|nr:triple tyrosine motif-containing protein [Allomuricauda flava]